MVVNESEMGSITESSVVKETMANFAMEKWPLVSAFEIFVLVGVICVYGAS